MNFGAEKLFTVTLMCQSQDISKTELETGCKDTEHNQRGSLKLWDSSTHVLVFGLTLYEKVNSEINVVKVRPHLCCGLKNNQ